MINFRISGISAAVAFFLSFLIGLVSRAAMPELIVRPLIFALVFFVLSGAIYYLVSHFLPELLSGDNGGYSSSAGADGAHLGSRVNITEGDASFMPPYTQGDFMQGGMEAGGVGAGFMGAQPDDSEDSVGNIADLFQRQNGSPASGFGGMEAHAPGSSEVAGAGMDQNAEVQYNGGEGETAKMQEGESDQFVPWEPPSFSGGADSGEAASMSSASMPSASVPSAAPAASGASFSPSLGSEDFFPDLDSMAGAFRSASLDGGSSAEHSSFAAPPKRSRSNSKAQSWSEDYNAKEIAMGLRTALNKDKEG